jgi:predicted O-linked N-acetylglucosamine transferase (SPINDLY family)
MATVTEALALARRHHEAGDLPGAEQIFRQILQGDPDNAQVWYLLGANCQIQGKAAEAIAALRRSLQLRPNRPEAHNHLGVTLAAQGDIDGAADCFREAIRLQPNQAEPHYNLALALEKQYRLDEAVVHDQQALRLQPAHADALNNLGNIWKEMGLLDDAIACYRRALAVQPNHLGAHSNLLLTLHYHPASDPDALFAEHRAWAQRHARPLQASIQPHSVDRDPTRRLRIGYLSPDFRDHVVGHLIEPILAAHDRSRFEITCYANVRRPDDRTRRMQSNACRWRSIVDFTDEQAAQLIRRDGIDILVDLAGHTSKNRILIFARKPAPVQVTYYGYADTTGLPTMDYRLTDAVAEPPGMTERYNTEELIRLPEIAWIYPPPTLAEANTPPAERTGPITFGSLNNLCKVTADAIALWSQILAAVPGTRLLMLTPGGRTDQRLVADFARHGIDERRLILVGKRARPEYFRLFQEVDVCLDTFPYSGCNTTCDALWMGVPVVTLSGRTFVHRQSVTILTHLGLEDFIAETPEDYREIAARLANDRARLTALRSGLRERMRGATLTDAPRFTRQLEDAFRRMWNQVLTRLA